MSTTVPTPNRLLLRRRTDAATPSSLVHPHRTPYATLRRSSAATSSVPRGRAAPTGAVVPTRGKSSGSVAPVGRMQVLDGGRRATASAPSVPPSPTLLGAGGRRPTAPANAPPPRTSGTSALSAGSRPTPTAKPVVAPLAIPKQGPSTGAPSGSLTSPSRSHRRKSSSVSRHTLTLHCMPSAGSFFIALRDALLRRSAGNTGTPGSSPPAGARTKPAPVEPTLSLESSARLAAGGSDAADTPNRSTEASSPTPFAAAIAASPAQHQQGSTPTRRGASHAQAGVHWVLDTGVDVAPRKRGVVPCCCRIEGVNVFLGDKTTTEAMIDEARVAAMRLRRPSTVFRDVPACPHKKRRLQLDPSMRSNQPHVTLCNYFSGLRDITLKARMVNTLCNAYSARTVFSEITPQTFIVYPRKAMSTDDRHGWLNAYQRPNADFPENMWIVKSSHGCHGDGICMVNGGNPETQMESAAVVLDFVDGQKAVHPYVVQRYVGNPFLIDGRKFDMRAWVLITPDFDVYLYRDGVCRMSGEAYVADDLSNRLIHLTNHCLQQEGKNYGKFEKGNELPFNRLDKAFVDGKHVLPTKGRSNGTKPSWRTFENSVYPQLVSIVLSTINAAKESVVSDPGSSVRSFQLMGYDFILDANVKLWLLEVNGSPGLADYLMDPIVRDTIELVVDPIFRRDKPSAQESDPASFMSPGNRYDLIHRFGPRNASSAASSSAYNNR